MRSLIRGTVTMLCVLAVTLSTCWLTLVYWSPAAHSANPYFTVHAITLSNHLVVKYNDYPNCKTEDPQPPANECVWNVDYTKPTGNGEGDSFYFDGTRIQYVWPENPVILSEGKWRWMPGSMRQHLAQEGLVLSTSCMWRTTGDDYSTIRCANGNRHVVNW